MATNIWVQDGNGKEREGCSGRQRLSGKGNETELAKRDGGEQAESTAAFACGRDSLAKLGFLRKTKVELPRYRGGG